MILHTKKVYLIVFLADIFKMIITAEIRWNSFYSISKSCIVFEFSALHASLNYCFIMCRLGCYYFSTLLKILGLHRLQWVQSAHRFLQRKHYTTVWFHICATFRCMACWTPKDTCSFCIELKICNNIWRFTSCKTGGN